jgi:hypothetical protein
LSVQAGTLQSEFNAEANKTFASNFRLANWPRQHSSGTLAGVQGAARRPISACAECWNRRFGAKPVAPMKMPLPATPPKDGNTQKSSLRLATVFLQTFARSSPLLGENLVLVLNTNETVRNSTPMHSE